MLRRLRAKCSGLVGLLLVALSLQLTGPLQGLGATSPVQASTDKASSDLVVVCSEGGVHYIHLDGTPANGPASQEKAAAGDCCALGCHLQGLVAPATVAALPMDWVRQFADSERIELPQSPPLLSFEARGPPLNA